MDQTLVSGLIPLVVPILIALGKAAIPILARRTWVLPILAPLLGALAEIAGYYAGLTSGDLLLGAILGGLGVCVREIADQAKKALTGEASTALRGLLLAIGLALASTGVAHAMTVTVDGVVATVEADEPTTNAPNVDGVVTPLDDLAAIEVRVDLGGGPEQCGVALATSPAGGGHVSASCQVPLRDGEVKQATFDAVAVDTTGNRSDPSDPVQTRLDRLKPGRPR